MTFALLFIAFDAFQPQEAFEAFPSRHATTFEAFEPSLRDGHSHDAIPQVMDDRLIQQRKDAYRRARERAEKYGAAMYWSDGKPGTALPAGTYRLFKHADGEVYFEESPKAIPKPDASLPESPDPLIVFPRASLGAADCIGQS